MKRLTLYILSITLVISTSFGQGEYSFDLQSQFAHGTPASGKITVLYGAGNGNTIKKPIIFAEGFDPHEYLPSQDNFSVHDAKREFPIAKLTELGFDVVFLDYHDGTASIRDNGTLMATLITWVNDNKHGIHPNVVIGYSMGGLVARIGLSYLEAIGIDHQTRLYVSLDAPHQGANMPLGYQFMIRDIANSKACGEDLATFFPKIKDLDRLLDAPATQELLIRQTSASGESKHRRFMQYYHNLGYPSQCRNIAVANGSRQGRRSKTSPHETLMEVSFTEDPLKNFVLGNVLLDDIILLGNASVKGNIKVNALPDHKNKTVYYNKIKIKKDWVWGLFSSYIKCHKARKKSGKGKAWDSAPGGTLPISQFMEGSDQTNIEEMGMISTDPFCFIPLISALDAPMPINQELFKALGSDPNLVDKLPFDAVYMPKKNESHFYFSGEAGAFLLEELLALQLPQTASADPKGLGLMEINRGNLVGTSHLHDGAWAGNWKYELEKTGFSRTGDFNGDGIRDIIVGNNWGIGIITFSGNRWHSLLTQPFGTRFGEWLFGKHDHISGVGDFNQDGKDDILIRSGWGIGILTLEGSTLDHLMLKPYGTKFGDWEIKKLDRHEAVADFNGDGSSDLLVSNQSEGLGILTLSGNGLRQLMKKPHGTKFGEWIYGKYDQIDWLSRKRDVNGDGKDDIVIRSSWGIGILTLQGKTLSHLMLKPRGTRFGEWLYGGEAIIGSGDYNGDQKDDLLIRSGWGIAILTLQGSSLTHLMLKPYETSLGGWHLRSQDQFLNRWQPGDFNGDKKDDLIVRSSWGIGVLEFEQKSLKAIDFHPFGTEIDPWTLEEGDAFIAVLSGIYKDRFVIRAKTEAPRIFRRSEPENGQGQSDNLSTPGEISLFHDDAASSLLLQAPQQNISFVQILDVQGRMVLSQTVPLTHTCSLSTESLSPGVYICQLRLEGKIQHTQKFVIR